MAGKVNKKYADEGTAPHRAETQRLMKGRGTRAAQPALLSPVLELATATPLIIAATRKQHHDLHLVQSNLPFWEKLDWRIKACEKRITDTLAVPRGKKRRKKCPGLRRRGDTTQLDHADMSDPITRLGRDLDGHPLVGSQYLGLMRPHMILPLYTDRHGGVGRYCTVDCAEQVEITRESSGNNWDCTAAIRGW